MREVINLNEDWYFSKSFNELPVFLPEDWETVDLPHTWNKYDGQDGGADYYRGQCWYVKSIEITDQEPESQIYLEFQAAANACAVYINGKKAACHEGGYSIFRADITSFLQKGSNLIAVSVDNTNMSHIYPQTADFTFYGGLYRDVNLLFVSESHFDLDYYGSTGLTVSSKIDGKDADITIHGFLTAPKEQDFVEFTISDEQGVLVGQGVRPAEQDTSVIIRIFDVNLWQGIESPYLYTVTARLVRHNEVLDEVETCLGVREFYVDPQKGFFLNGKSMPLRGVSRHQDKLGLGNALTYEDHFEDALLIQETGANTIRLAHYQHSQDFYDLCDKFGFIVWAEIPFISSMNPDPKAHENCISQMKDLIYQNYNHPSICFWGISNEITMGGTNNPKLTENLKDLNRLVHELDPSRLTTMAQLSSLPKEDEQNQITDILSYNHYFGWYSGSFEDNEKWLDEFHQLYPNRALGISEYGCEGIISYHNDNPKAGDYSEEYQSLYHEHMAKIIEERPWLWATHIWNMFDFGCDARNEGGVKGRNNKGLITFDRKIRKDIFYLYKAYWSNEPVVHICGKRYAKRPTDKITLKVYTNCPSVSLIIDNQVFKTLEGEKVLEFTDVPLKDGFTTILAKSENAADTITLEKVDKPYEPYVLVEDNPSGVTNWFENIDFSQQAPMEFKEGYFSIRDKVGDILANEEAADIILNGLSSMAGMPIKKSMLSVMSDRTISDMSHLNPAANSEAQLAFLNQQLQKVKK